MKNLIIALTVVLFAACNITKDTKAKDDETGKSGASAISYKVLKQEEYSGRETEGNIVLKTQGELNNLYEELRIGTAPVVDFSKQTVVALFMGQKSSGGYSIGIENVTGDGKSVTVSIKKKSPEGMATMALSQPYCIASITTNKPINFK